MAGSLAVSGGAAPALLQELQRDGFEFCVEGDRLRIRPAERITPELRDALKARKAELLPIVWRLAAMRRLAVEAPRAVVYARPEAHGGPGFCFSCGDALEHATAYGRCTPCDIAADVFYASGEKRRIDRSAERRNRGSSNGRSS